MDSKSHAAALPGLFERLGLVGLSSIEAPVLASLATRSPLLLIGAHGSGKSLLLERIAVSLGFAWRHYSASLVNFDDLVGYPVPDGNNGLRFIQTPASIWGAQAVFIDEISRARVDIQNRLFPIIHERKVQGLPLPDLQHRWAAMNPPPDRDSDDPRGEYAGSVELDIALADRFPFHLRVPEWQSFAESDQERLILSHGVDPDPSVGPELARIVEAVRAQLPVVRAQWAPSIARYLRLLSGLLQQSDRVISARRAARLGANISAMSAVPPAFIPFQLPSWLRTA